ncbi:UDP-3-O-acyl-N-acetylglucosamine deacetylase [Desulfolucanica intricata]|uniref:UDP-3-O-acyl-N-acetylglucosamine deacetylase n=1 Tax=Desulfolucanica intricata TaxID=1285191 RepID=UPI00082CEEE2|nr:UDP-3-O-acyl-N-acetylglucosamine deacetylase [Desulfolucanica intricata]
MQKSIKYPGRCSGIDITGRGYTTITFHPAQPDSGIVFVREDLPGHPEIKCHPEYARADSRWTSLVKNDIRIEHTEHLLAAITGLGIDNLRIHLDSPHIPVVSSFSSQGFVEELLKAEPFSQNVPKKYFIVQEPHWVFDSFTYEGQRYDSVLLALPAQQFSLTYLLDYPGKQLATQLAYFNSTLGSNFIKELAPARSYIMDFEYEQVSKLIGNAMDDCLVISHKALNLKWNNEPARHKLLDLLGDLSTMGQAIKGHFIGIRTGHKINIQMCHKLYAAGLRRN